VNKITGIMAYHCYYCSDVFKTISQNYQHARVAHEEIIQKSWIPCLNCKKYFPTEKSANSHNYSYHPRNHVEQNSGGWITCKACDKKIQNVRNFVQHMTICNGNKEMQSEDSKMFKSSPNERRNHIRGWTTCKACDQKIQNGRNFDQHMTICNENKEMQLEDLKPKPVNISTTKTHDYGSDNSESVYIHARIQHTKEMDSVNERRNYIQGEHSNFEHFVLINKKCDRMILKN
jgi:hypothetical protein